MRNGTWLSLAEHAAGGRGVAGSNPAVPTTTRTFRQNGSTTRYRAGYGRANTPDSRVV
jgi:hypothetical protein